MRLVFSWPTTAQFGGGVDAVFEWGNAMRRRGHDVHIVHAPKTADRISSVDELGWFSFEQGITHEIADSLADASEVGDGSDVCFQPGAPERLGQPAALIQGYKLLSATFERPAFRASCPKFCVATWLLDIGAAWGSPPEQLLHLPVGLDPLFHAPVPEGPRPVDVAMLHTAHPVKGGPQGVEALVELRRRRPSLTATCFGYGERDGSLPEWIEFRRAPSRAVLRDEVLGRAKVFLQPARREGFGLTPVEAMASGCALVSTDNGGSRDYAFDGRTALIVPFGEPAATASAIGALLDDHDARSALARAGKDVSRQFDWDRSATILESHLERYLADPGAMHAPPTDAPLFLDEEL